MDSCDLLTHTIHVFFYCTGAIMRDVSINHRWYGCDSQSSDYNKTQQNDNHNRNPCDIL